ncbi:MAG: nucleotidyltransferase domain-containing protein [Methanobrevibacter sp.]|nr:nucleotidyltransferase domain-containing protein [Candidatus Methanoflexus mossambicus]
MIRKQIAIDFAQSINNKSIEKIILFGSVARGDDTEDSDIDILIIVKDPTSEFSIKKEIYEKVFNVLMNEKIRISVKIRTKEFYQKYINSSFLSNVIKDGVIIG